jgi:ketosteroid isomerase-like protein
MKEETQVMATLEDCATAYCAKNIDALMSVFADGESILLIGTGGDELCSGRDAVKAVFLRNFRDATAKRFEWHWKDIVVTDYQAVVAITLTIHLDFDGTSLEVPVRWTVALKKDSNRWVRLHRHASSAAPGQEEGAAYPTHIDEIRESPMPASDKQRASP